MSTMFAFISYKAIIIGVNFTKLRLKAFVIS